jgi:hypothetical protein
LQLPQDTHIFVADPAASGALTFFAESGIRRPVIKLPAARVLINWLKRRTREEVCPWLSTLAAEYGFKFGESLVRGQKTRWGSCSSKGTISISSKLLFLERDWVRCVLIHELCHTVFMDHSQKFRGLFESHRAEMRAD